MRPANLLVALVTVLLGFELDAATVEFAGKSYEVVDWDTANATTDTADGTAGGVSVGFSTFELNSGITTRDYSLGGAFDVLTYPGGGTFERIEFFGAEGFNTSDTLSFDTPVTAVLFIIGSPNTALDPSQFGPSQWDFPDSLTMTVIDTEGTIGLEILPGNILNNGDTTGQGNHRSGLVLVEGLNATDLSWVHVLPPGSTDKMNITFAIIAVPIPPSIVLCAAGFALLRARRRTRINAA